MKTLFFCLLTLSCILNSCILGVQADEPILHSIDNVKPENSQFNFISDIIVPDGFTRKPSEPNTFKSYLRRLPLKSKGSPVLHYDGTEKSRSNVHHAVIDLPIGKRDLHQCADAIIRLRAEYLYEQKRYSEIHFNFTNGFNAEYTKWRQGNRIKVNGNKVTWTSSSSPSTDRKSFWKYLEMVFSYAGTASFEKELHSKSASDLEIGDVFIQGGFPGHAIIVVDKCINHETDKELFMLAQSYMPAQEIHVLKNLNKSNQSPWYDLDFGEQLITPEWTFNKGDLKSF